MSLVVGGEGQLTARVYDGKNQTITASFEWSSANSVIATVGKSDGIVTAISAGNTVVTATFGALRATATVSVRPAEPAVSVYASPSALTLIAGEVERLTARAYDAKDRTTNASVEWSSPNPAVATVETNGTVTAMSAGSTTVTAAVGVLRATVPVSVVATAGSLFGTVAFTRMSWASGNVIFDVLTLSGADRTPRSLPRPAQFASIRAPAWSPDAALLAVEVISAYFPEDWQDYNSDLMFSAQQLPPTRPGER